MFKPGILVYATIVLVLLTVSVLGLAYIIGYYGESDYPSVSYSKKPEFKTSERNFEFQGEMTGITYLIDQNLSKSADNTDKSAYLTGFDRKFSDWHSRYYDSFINSPEMDGTYSSVLFGLSEIRDKRELNSDEYAELITVFVQSIPYFSDPKSPEIKYPVETLYDGWGDCDDKSILLAGLLSKSRYNISLFYFEPENHTGVGIASENNTFKETGYAYIETVDKKRIGDPDMTLPSGKMLLSDPELIKVKGGEITYSGKLIEQ